MQKKLLKKAFVGFEIEFFTINKKGQIMPAADNILKKIRDSKREQHTFHIKKECTTHYLEIATAPYSSSAQTMNHLVRELEYAYDIAEPQGVLFYPFGTYPGKFNPVMRPDPRYRIQESIFGKKRFNIAGRVVGFHCHYTLPRGMFDSQLRILKMFTNSKIKDSLVNSYNLMVAADPALTTFMQSSPFYQGAYIAKDSRVIMYRGGAPFNNPQSLYANLEEFGGLPPYKLTGFDIMEILNANYETWKAYIKKLGINLRTLSLYGSILDTYWGALKINDNGTLEVRGMDMNFLSNILGIGTIIRHVQKMLQEEFYAVVPADIGIREPFKVEGDVIYIPPYSYVKNDLQKNAAYKGFENEAVYNYCKRFLKFAESVIPKEELACTKPLHEMLSRRRTVSDDMLKFAQKRGYRKKDALSNKLATEIALHYSGKFMEDMRSTKDFISTHAL